ncbi:OB-fold domain-containing protein [Novosphingobium sp. fls2-241-R2A-195]|uniref:Zn-ribbon domain-containing OB-fold protein n=1 Tax=Novosphingobium sp. fls2-241-R2A-195 TaxID=3040296 RepID=UPI00254AFDF1|nr:OB-fold domain-containing protein [Novosphingobium sp. fls2-241-R2A-195]
MTEPDDLAVFAYFHDVHVDRDNIAHYRGLMRSRLLVNRCNECGHWIYPHRPLCPECLSFSVEPAEVSGLGRLHMWTLIHQSRDPDKPLAAPLLAAAIELVEQPGLRYLSRVVGCPPERLRHDMPVQLTWIEEEGRRWPAFTPLEVG